MATQEDNECDISGVCTAPYGARTVTNCIYCSKELVEVNGEWFTWDFDQSPNPRPQEQEGRPLKG